MDDPSLFFFFVFPPLLSLFCPFVIGSIHYKTLFNEKVQKKVLATKNDTTPATPTAPSRQCSMSKLVQWPR